jgi:hypothetical protein
MLTYKEMAEPAPGWRLDRIRRLRGFWEVALMCKLDGTILDYSDSDLERAFTGAVRAAEGLDARRAA